MRWIEVAMEVDGEAAEAVVEVLYRYGHQGVAIERGGFGLETWEDEPPPPARLIVRAYFPDDEQTEAARAQLEQALHHLGRLYPMPTPQYRVIDDEDWAEAWKAHYHPVRLGRRLLIRPLWIDSVETRPGDIVIALDPGMAFGTGTHPSTQLVLETAEELLDAKLGCTVLDLGCGSGILAIGAAKLGAGQVWALDTDPVAVRVATENAAANAVGEQVVVRLGTLSDLLKGEGDLPRAFDLALVNILAKTIIALCRQGLGQVIRPGGVGVFSGIIEEQVGEVEAALRETGLLPYRRRSAGDWVVIEARREAP